VPFNARPDQMGAMAKLGAFFRDNGLYTFVRWNNFFVNPPLCITEEQLLEGLAIVTGRSRSPTRPWPPDEVAAPQPATADFGSAASGSTCRSARLFLSARFANTT